MSIKKVTYLVIDEDEDLNIPIGEEFLKWREKQQQKKHDDTQNHYDLLAKIEILHKALDKKDFKIKNQASHISSLLRKNKKLTGMLKISNDTITRQTSGGLKQQSDSKFKDHVISTLKDQLGKVAEEKYMLEKQLNALSETTFS